MAEPDSAGDGRTVTVRVPIHIPEARRAEARARARRAPKYAAPVARDVDNAMVKAIARAFRWREMLENGAYATIEEIAAAEKINESYVGRVLRLTLLAPDIVEAILDGRQPAELQLDALLTRFPVEWERQRTLVRLIT